MNLPRAFRAWIPGLVLVAVCLAGLPETAYACMSSKPPPPFCGKTLVLSKAVPGVVLLPGGGVFIVPTLVFFGLVDFPPGSGICPLGPYAVTVSLTATCAPPPGGGGATTVAITPGFNPVAVPVTVGAGPPRLCTITGTATVALADGMTLTAAGDTVVCIGDPAPGNPDVPRLDMQILGPSGSEIVRVHPGDQASYEVRVTNNDPTESFSGELTVEMVNSSRLPAATGPMPPGTGVFSISDPVEGDNFPIAFDEGLFQGCVPVPADHTNPEIPTLDQPVELGPGESKDITVYARPPGMCANGSCGEGKLILDGDFSDTTPGLACAGFITAADSSVPPSYAWPDAGQAGRVAPDLPDNVVTLFGAPIPKSEVSIDFVTFQSQLIIDGLPSTAFAELFSDRVHPERGRTQILFFDKVLDPGSLYGVSTEILVKPSPGQPIQTELVQMELIAGAPTGFENLAPVGLGLVEVRDLEARTELQSVVEATYQLDAVGIDDLGEHREIAFGAIDMSRKQDGSGFDVRLLDGVVAPGAGANLVAIQVSQDVRSFHSLLPQGALVFADGFESGDIRRWSVAVP